MHKHPNFGLRPARIDEFPFAEALYIDAMRPLMQQLGKWDETLRRAAIRRSFRASESQIISQEGKDIGWMQILERDADYNIAQIQILDAYCGQGIGTRLICDLLAKAKAEAKTVSLSAVRTNRAIGLYQRLGFRMIDPAASPILDMVWQPSP